MYLLSAVSYKILKESNKEQLGINYRFPAALLYRDIEMNPMPFIFLRGFFHWVSKT